MQGYLLKEEISFPTFLGVLSLLSIVYGVLFEIYIILNLISFFDSVMQHNNLYSYFLVFIILLKSTCNFFYYLLL